MKKFTKGQKIFLFVYPVVGLILSFLCVFLGFASESHSVAQALSRLLMPLIAIIFYPPYMIGGFLHSTFHSHWSVLYFLAFVYHFFLGFIFIIVYKKICNR